MRIREMMLCNLKRKKMGTHRKGLFTYDDIVFFF
jgi:hypothetical protein